MKKLFLLAALAIVPAAEAQQVTKLPAQDKTLAGKAMAAM